VKNNDEIFMKRAVSLARRGAGLVSPNPMVGSVIVRSGKIIGEGWHEKFGANHAEINAIENASGPVKGATLYVTLEPCSHHGKTPPCVGRIINEGLAKVVIGAGDPNPLVSGRGIKALEKSGVRTSVGVLESECTELNEKFFKYMRSGMPFVTLKIAQSLDGRIAASTGDSRWISSTDSRKMAHRERGLHDAVMVGIGTVIQDDPELTVRLARGRNPLRVVLDSGLRVPFGARLLDQSAAKTLVACSSRHDKAKFAKLRAMGIEVIVSGDESVDHVKLLRVLAARNISSVLVEGGAGLYTAFLRANLADRVLAFVAPKIIGKGIEAFGELGTLKIADSRMLEIRKLMRRGPDIVVDARVIKSKGK